MTARRALAALQCFAVVGGFAVAVVAVATGGAGASAPQSGYALGFGNDASGQIGSGIANDGTRSPTPAKLPAGITAVQIAVGYSHTVALGSDGIVYAWGSNDHGELGTGTGTASKLPTPVSLPSGTTVTAVAAGYLDSFAVTSTGAVYAWGYGALGELGDGALADALTPTAVHLPVGVALSAVSAGYAHTLAVSTTGAVYAWGSNSSGQLGDGTLTLRTTPVRVTLPGGATATAVAAGYQHSLALTSAGHVYAWGANNNGQLGTGGTTPAVVPAPVAFGAATVTSISAGYLHSVATLSDGSARAWGDNSNGQLGLGQPGSTVPNVTSPTAVVLGGAQVTEAVAGVGHTLLLTDAGAVLATGDNSYGELGTGDTNSATAPVPSALPAGATAFALATSAFSLTSFVLVPSVATTTNVTTTSGSVSAGQPVTFTATVSPNSGVGSVSFTSGDPATPLPGCSNLPLRRGSAGDASATCSTAALPEGTTAIGASYAGSAPYADSAGTLSGGQSVQLLAGLGVAWGGNGSGQLGDDSTANRTLPVASFPTGTQLVQVSGGANHAIALLSDGSVYAWGDNTYGELGNGTAAASKVPVPVSVPAGVVPVSVAAGTFTSALVAADGRLYTWGLNNAGQLGDGTTTNRSLPSLAVLPAGTIVTAVSLGGAHLLALGSTGAVYAAGGNTVGQLGNNSTAPVSTPVAVHLPASAAAAGVSAGYAHSLAVTTDGAVFAWGDNSHGELGDGTSTSAVVPVAATLPAGTSVAALSAGYFDSVALATDGTALGWGDNTSGELGNGSTADAALPTAVSLPAGTTLTSIAAGKQSTYALTDTGAVLAWGDNASGSLGDGTTTSRTAPVAVHLPTAIVAIGAGGVAGYAILPQLADQTGVTSSANPSTAGTEVTFTATVTPTDGGGTVRFTDNGDPITGCAAVPLSGTSTHSAACSTTTLAGGSHDIVADYSGDLLYEPSTGSLSGGQTVNVIATTTKLATSAAKVSYTKSVTFTASVSGSDGGGTVAFSSDGVVIAGCAAVSLTRLFGPYQAKCATTALPPGQHVITADYSGDAMDGPSSATLTGGELVTAATKLVASSVKIGDPQGLPTYRAVLSLQADGSPLPDMVVTFKLNTLYGASSCTATTDSLGVATCQGARPRVSGGQYTAKFAGTDIYLTSSGSATVNF